MRAWENVCGVEFVEAPTANWTELNFYTYQDSNSRVPGFADTRLTHGGEVYVVIGINEARSRSPED